MSDAIAAQNELNTKARTAAQAAVEGLAVKPTARVEYRSRGRVAVIGGEEAMEFAPRLEAPLHPQVVLLHGAEEPGAPVIPVGGRAINVEGYMGNFRITLGDEGKATYETVDVDLILDLSPTPLLDMPIKPAGYFTSGTDELSLVTVIEQLTELVGTFEKPRYFDYDASICAHGRAGQTGCRRCIDSCPAEAITALAESIEVNPYLCQGGGICASVCPTGAIRYTYPDAADTLERIRNLLRVYRDNSGQNPVVAFVAETDTESLNQIPANMLIVVVEELASVGLEIWLATLAYGATSVLLINGGSVPARVIAPLNKQLDGADAILTGLGYPAHAVRMIESPVLVDEGEPVMAEFEPANFTGLTEKRRVAFLAIDHLYEQSLMTAPIIPLPPGSPFGTIHVDDQACTMCLSCSSVCPANAVEAGNETPRLIFHESNCVQCGICSSACPERAITLESRLIADAELRRRTTTLHEEPPFCCVVCGKPFATNSVIQNMLTRLEGHWMYQDERAKRRLMMCEDCRVVDVIQDPEAMEKGLVNPPRQ